MVGTTRFIPRFTAVLEGDRGVFIPRDMRGAKLVPLRRSIIVGVAWISVAVGTVAIVSFIGTVFVVIEVIAGRAGALPPKAFIGPVVLAIAAADLARKRIRPRRIPPGDGLRIDHEQSLAELVWTTDGITMTASCLLAQARCDLCLCRSLRDESMWATSMCAIVVGMADAEVAIGYVLGQKSIDGLIDQFEQSTGLHVKRSSRAVTVE